MEIKQCVVRENDCTPSQEHRYEKAAGDIVIRTTFDSSVINIVQNNKTFKLERKIAELEDLIAFYKKSLGISKESINTQKEGLKERLGDYNGFLKIRIANSKPDQLEIKEIAEVIKKRIDNPDVDELSNNVVWSIVKESQRLIVS
jgi:hypothetical protein